MTLLHQICGYICRIHGGNHQEYTNLPLKDSEQPIIENLVIKLARYYQGCYEYLNEY